MTATKPAHDVEPDGHCYECGHSLWIICPKCNNMLPTGEFEAAALTPPPPGDPIPMVLHCPKCGLQHIDREEPPHTEHTVIGGDIAEVEVAPGWANPPHRSHLCAGCGHIWRPADVPTTGVAAIQTRGKADSPPPPPPGDDELIDGLARAIFNIGDPTEALSRPSRMAAERALAFFRRSPPTTPLGREATKREPDEDSRG
jgi:hypothetical protein